MPVVRQTIELSDTPKFTPAKVGRGDRDFDGHGPEVRVSATMWLRNGDELWVRVAMHGKETKRDYTEVNGSADYLMRKHNKPILRVLSDTYSDARYTDGNHEDDVILLGGDELVREFVCVGDTKGNEAGISTGVTVRFHPVVLEVLK